MLPSANKVNLTTCTIRDHRLGGSQLSGRSQDTPLDSGRGSRCNVVYEK